jgi:hypothetical protein
MTSLKERKIERKKEKMNEERDNKEGGERTDCPSETYKSLSEHRDATRHKT